MPVTWAVGVTRGRAVKGRVALAPATPIHVVAAWPPAVAVTVWGPVRPGSLNVARPSPSVVASSGPAASAAPIRTRAPAIGAPPASSIT